MSRAVVCWPSRWEVSIMAHIQQFSDEDRDMRIMCYVICAIAVAICIGLLFYTAFL